MTTRFAPRGHHQVLSNVFIVLLGNYRLQYPWLCPLGRLEVNFGNNRSLL